MSYSTIYLVPKRGPVKNFKELQNSWGTLPAIWNYIQEKYMPNGRFYMTDMKIFDELINLANTDRLNNSEKICLYLTYDKCMVKKENFPRVQKALIDIYGACRKKNPNFVNHLEVTAKTLEEMAKDKNCYAFCWNGTSVCDEHWRAGKNFKRMYSITRDKGHWFLDEHCPEVFVEEIK